MEPRPRCHPVLIVFNPAALENYLDVYGYNLDIPDRTTERLPRET